MKSNKNYYGMLFKRRDSELENVKFDKVLNQEFATKLSKVPAQSFECLIVRSEFSKALKHEK